MTYGRHMQAYRANQVMTADPGTILLLLYQGAIDFLRQAKNGLEKKDMAEKGQNISRALAIIGELQASLNFEVGGEVAHNLDNLYLFMTNHVTKANLSNDAQLLEETIALLATLKEGWEGAVLSERKRMAEEAVPQLSTSSRPSLARPYESTVTART